MTLNPLQNFHIMLNITKCRITKNVLLVIIAQDLRVFFAGCTAAKVTCYIEDYFKLFANDTITVVSSDYKER